MESPCIHFAFRIIFISIKFFDHLTPTSDIYKYNTYPFSCMGVSKYKIMKAISTIEDRNVLKELHKKAVLTRSLEQFESEFQNHAKCR